MDKNMSQTRSHFAAPKDSGHQKSETNFDEDSGLGVSGYSHDYSLLDKDSAKSKGPQEETTKQIEAEEQDYLDSGFGSGFHIEPKEMGQKIQVPIEVGLEQLHLTEPKQQDAKKPRALSEMQREIFSQDEDGDTQLHIAISSASPALIRKIIDYAPYPDLLDIENIYGQSPIHLAVLMAQSMIVRHLLIRGAKATVRDYEGNTPLHLACRNNDLHSAAAILNPISSAELKNYYRLTSEPPKYQRIPIDLEQRNYYGEHCIHMVVQSNNTDILKYLLHAGADINAREGRGGYTPLHIAVENHNEGMVKFLLKHGAGKINVETHSYGQITAYQLASDYRLPKIMEHLAKFGCEQLPYPESDYSTTDESDMDSDED